MYGPQSALVTGPKGEEIYIDDFGRIKVQFMWDQVGKKDENSSCFIRVMQSFAGNGWGSSFIPRIGHEVIISFLDGDPDRPIVTGSVYNGNNKPPFTSKTQSGIKTRSSKKGTSDNFNELSFEDKKDSEKVYIQAEKDLEGLVKNNQRVDIGNNDNLTVGKDRMVAIKNNEFVTVDNDQTTTVKNNKNTLVENDSSVVVKNNHLDDVSKNKTVNVGQDHDESVGGNMVINVAKDLRETIKGEYAESVTKGYGLQAKGITLEADDEITIKTGSAKIIMKKNGEITISGKDITFKGSGKITAKASGNVILKGSKVVAN